MTLPAPPLALLAEITHRCPMRCIYCSNPVELVAASGELNEAVWLRVVEVAANLGVLQVHFSGGEPLARRDVFRLIAQAAKLGLYTNLITSGIRLDTAVARQLAGAGLEHVQLSVQDTESAGVELIGGLAGAFEHKHRAAEAIAGAGLALTLNAVVHRGNAGRIGAFIDLALAMGARRLEVAHVQYYGWGLLNRARLMPTLDQVRAVTHRVEVARARYKGVLGIDYVVPDYYARLPKACMGGWGRRFMVIDPAGRALPCHAATTIPGLAFANVRDAALADIWLHSAAFNVFRGTEWMAEPRRSCDQRELDWGGCRCQALALAGDAAATDPACHRSGVPRIGASRGHRRAGGAGGGNRRRRPNDLQGPRPRNRSRDGRHRQEGREGMFWVLIADDHPLFPDGPAPDRREPVPGARDPRRGDSTTKHSASERRRLTQAGAPAGGGVRPAPAACS